MAIVNIERNEQIRQMRKSGETYQNIADVFNITKQAICEICNRKSKNKKSKIKIDIIEWCKASTNICRNNNTNIVKEEFIEWKNKGKKLIDNMSKEELFKLTIKKW